MSFRFLDYRFDTVQDQTGQEMRVFWTLNFKGQFCLPFFKISI